ncbi:MAG: NAD(P)-dependent oxidoreductase [Phycisphaerae bacterium]
MSAPARFRFVVAESYPASALERLRAFGDVVELPDPTPDALISALPGTHALLIRSRTHVTARILEAAAALRVIGRAATSVDHIDLRVAARRNIVVVYAPHAGVRSLAEFTVAMLLAAQRRLIFLDRHVRAGQFESLRETHGRELRHHVVGLFGMSRVADEVGAMLAESFGCKVIYHDRSGRTPTRVQAEAVSQDALFERSDILSLHLALDPSTRQIINAAVLGRMPAGAILVNTSRGGLIDSAAVADALKAGRLRGAAIDVFDTEPLPAEHALRTAPNCILTPHVGSLTTDARDALFDVVDDVLGVLAGQPPRHPAAIEPAPPRAASATA